MLFKDFLFKNRSELSKSKILFDWYFPSAYGGHLINYELEMDEAEVLRYKPKADGGWRITQLSTLRKFKILEISVSRRKLLGHGTYIRVTTDNNS